MLSGCTQNAEKADFLTKDMILSTVVNNMSRIITLA
jgi:hypothetical protein